MALALGLQLAAPSAAEAQLATGGVGKYRNNIVWFSWSANNSQIPQAGTTVTNSVQINGLFLRTTCSLSNIAGTGTPPSLVAYRPGGWQGDGLDELYNIGGTGTANQLIVGLRNRSDGTDASMTFSCSATYGASNSAADPVYPLEGLVFADAEQSNSGSSNPARGEYVSGTLTGPGTFRILETYKTPGCATNGTATVSGSTLTLNGSSPVCAAGPMAVA